MLSGLKADKYIGQLLRVALAGLQAMYDPAERLFCHRLRRRDRALSRQGRSLRYTLIALLGLERLSSHGIEVGLPIADIYDSVLSRAARIARLGDLGLLLWLSAFGAPEKLAGICAALGAREALSRYPDGRNARTTSLAWFLTGLAFVAQRSGYRPAWLHDMADQAFRLLSANQRSTGLFGHLRPASVQGALRGRIGSFADQAYPIYALCCHGQESGCEQALGQALKCSQALCRLQGTQGQWWWHYNARTGRVSGRYPVFSVHQAAMAPMALRAAEALAGGEFGSCSRRGLEWLMGANELRTPLIDADLQVIWRSIDRRKCARLLEESGFRRPRGRQAHPRDLFLRHESRPYHLGWILYTYADEYHPAFREAARRL